jgi:cupin 2 domain-containing protein
MAEADLERFLAKVQALQAFVAASEADPGLRQRLAACGHHDEVVALAASMGFPIARRWGEPDQPTGGEAKAADDNLLAHQEMLQPGEERTTVVLQTANWRLERIHSCQARSPEGFWYDQDESEWVCLLQGRARLRFEDEPRARELRAGDQLQIAPHRRHRVEETDGGSGSVWLALFWREN